MSILDRPTPRFWVAAYGTLTGWSTAVLVYYIYTAQFLAAFFISVAVVGDLLLLRMCWADMRDEQKRGQ